ncbi:MAG: periplasmic heavy metal sensor [candidate division Zixibacteria bacterium]|nr:periplasmic heavy metal sensor [candidate division Zixibacteria bacterium]
MLKHKRLIGILISIAVLVFLCSGLAYSQSPEKEKIFKARPGLSAEQKEKIKEITLERVKDGIRIKADLKIAQIELRELMQQDELDKAKIDRKIDEIGALRTKLQKAKFEKRMALREVLTKERLQSLREKRTHRMMERRLMDRKSKGKEGMLQRKRIIRKESLSGEIPPSYFYEEFEELPLMSEELPLEPELFTIEEDNELLAPLDRLPLFPEELQPPE